MSDSFDGAGLIGTGIGLGVMTLGAMVPLVIMKKMLDENGDHHVGKSHGNGFKVNVPRLNVNFKAPSIKVKKIKIK